MALTGAQARVSPPIGREAARRPDSLMQRAGARGALEERLAHHRDGMCWRRGRGRADGNPDARSRSRLASWRPRTGAGTGGSPCSGV